MDEQKWESRLKVLTQVAGISFVVVYVVGFLTVSIYHVRYGIPSFTFLRPKIISAGVLFVVLLSLPLWELASLYDWIKIPKPAQANSDSRMNQAEATPFWTHVYVPTLKLSLFIAASFGIAFFTDLYLAAASNFATGGWVLGSIVIGGAAYAFSVQLARKRQVVSFGLVLIVPLIYAFVTWRTHDRGFQLFALWFLVCGVTAKQARRAKTDPANFFGASLHNIILNLLMPLLFFAVLLYPRIKPAVGGGAPMPVTIYCSDVPPFTTSNEIKAKLLDETDLGFYLLLGPDDKQAVFLPRAGVRAIKFGF